MRARPALSLLGAAICLAACQQAPPPAASLGVAQAPLTVEGRAPALADNEVLLDVIGDQALIGQLAPAPKNADPPLRLTAFVATLPERDVRRPLRTAPGADPLIERARWLAAPTQALVTLRDRQLVALDVASGAQVALDDAVIGAVGASLDGRYLVYTTGDAPDLEIVWRDRQAAAPRPVTRGMAPTWSPGVSPDGRTVFFVSGTTGLPSWWRSVDGAAPQQITNVGLVAEPGQPLPELAPFAAGLGPTLVSEGHVIFEGQGAVHVMTHDGQVVRTVQGARAPFWRVAGASVGMLAAGGTLVTLALTPAARGTR